jgi:hypothetical protein
MKGGTFYTHLARVSSKNPAFTAGSGAFTLKNLQDFDFFLF